MKAVWFACLALHLWVTEAYLLDNQVAAVTDRYVINEGECLPIHSEENLLHSIKSVFDECVLLCDDHAECQSFLWNENETLCQTYNSICHNHTSVSYTYSLSKRERKAILSLVPKLIFSSTYFLRMFGACRSNDSMLTNNMSISTIEDCANECANYPRCQYASFSNESRPNCRIDENFCDTANERIQRGNHHWQLLKRISDAPFDYLHQVSIVKYDGIPSNTSKTMATAALYAEECVRKCVETHSCVAAAYSTSNKPQNCLLLNETFDPINNLLHSGKTTWQTYLVANDYRDMNLTSLNGTEFIWKPNGDYSGAKLMNTFNLSSEIECAIKCANTTDCTAFKFTNNKDVNTDNCQLHANWQHVKSGNFKIFIRLSFPYEENGVKYIRHRYEDGASDNIIMHDFKSFRECASLCSNLDDCDSFLHIQPRSKQLNVNCIPKKKHPGYIGPSNIFRLLLDGLNTYSYANDNQRKTDEYANYTVHNGYCFDPARTKSKYMKIRQDKCKLMCDELAQCKGFLVKDGGNATATSCVFIYNECGNTSQSKPGIESFEKKRDEESQYLFGQTHYTRWFGDCLSTNNQLLKINVSSTAECAAECSKRARCDYFTWNSMLGTTDANCIIGTSFCFQSKDRIFRGDRNRQLFQRINHESFDYIESMVITMFNGICDTGVTNWISPKVESAALCGLECIKMSGCTAYSYTRSPSDWNWKYNNQQTNCVLRTKMCDPSDLRRSEDPDWETYEIVADLSGLQRIVIGETEFLNDTRGSTSGDVLQRYNTFNESDCAVKCAQITECEAFRYVPGSTADSNCEIVNNISWNGTSGVAKLIRLSFPVQAAGQHYIRYKYDCGYTLELVVAKDFADCAKKCQQNSGCLAFLYTDSEKQFGPIFNCGPKDSFCQTGAQSVKHKAMRLLLPGWNTYVFSNSPLSTPEVELSEFQKHPVGYGIAIAVVLIIVTGGLVILIVTIWRKFKHLKELTYLDRDLNNPSKEIDPILPVFEQLENLKLDEKFELPLDRIDVDRKTLKTLGMGNFGRVVLGNYKMPDGNSVSVAIKRTRSSWDAEQYRMLFKEICLMANIGKHPNLVNLVGAVTQIAKGHLYLVMDYCSNGSLRQFIIKSVEENQFHNEIVSNGSEESYAIKSVETNQLCTSDLLSFAFQIASGMEYVASVKLVHRDLAARNVLLTSDLIAKISDFGLGRQEYQFYETDKTVLLPIRWTSPEALLLHKFSTRSDVWSFGVTLGEIFSLGTVPFANVSKFDRSFAEDLKEGRLIVPKPQFSPERVYKLITHCCMPDPKNRVSFPQCKELLLDEFRFCNSTKFGELIDRLLVIQKSYPQEENLEISTSTGPAAPAIESSSKRPSFLRFLPRKSSASQKGLEELMSKEFQREHVELNMYH